MNADTKMTPKTTITCMNPKILKGASCYLPGGMQFAADFGVGWRRRFIELAENADLGLSITDPTDKTRNKNIWFPFLHELSEEQAYAKELKAKGDWDALTDYVHSYRRIDLRCVDQADFMVAMIDTRIHLCRTYDEVFTAEDQKKPIFAIVPEGRKNAPDWLFGVIKWQEMFEDIESCVDYLVKINTGKVELDDRWVLITEKTLF